MNRIRILITITSLLLPLGALAENDCTLCHEDPKFRVQHRTLYDYAQDFEVSVHGVAGLACSDCHGGDASASDLDVVHAGVMDAVRYDHIADMCGSCHEEQRNAFVSSRHARILAEDGTAPNCVTCHGAMDMSSFNVSNVKSACLKCHTKAFGVAPEVPERAEELLLLINNIKGYRKFVNKRGDDPAFLSEFETRYEHLSAAWHRFDLGDVITDAQSLFEDLQSEKDRIIAARHKSH